MSTDASTEDVASHRRFPKWALPAGGGVVAAALLSVTLVVHASGSPACASAAAPPLAAPPVAGTTHSGKATHFDGSNGGNCSFGPPSTDLYVALGPSEYSAGAACGGYLDVTGPKGTARVKVVDKCPECAQGHLDLSRAAFARIGNLNDGIIRITYQGVRDPQVPGPIQMRVKDGASAFWLAILADNVGAPLAKVELRTASGGWFALARTDFNYWIDEDGAGAGPYGFRLTDVYGRQATVGGITMSPLKTQNTGAFLSGGGAAAKAPSTASTRKSSAAAPVAPSSAPEVPPSSAAPSGPEPLSSTADAPALVAAGGTADGSCG